MKGWSFTFQVSCAALVLVVPVPWAGNTLAQDHLESRETILLTQSPRRQRPTTKTGRDEVIPLLPAPRSRIVRLTDSAVDNLTPEFESAAHPCLSPDAMQVLFVARTEASQRFRVWQMNIDGHEKREVVHCDGDCIQPIWLSTLYTLDDDAPTPRIAFVCVPADGEVPAVFTCRPDGTQVRQITFHPWGAAQPAALPDGRLAFQVPGAIAASEDMKPELGSAQWLAVQIDGTDLTALQSIPQNNAADLAIRPHSIEAPRSAVGHPHPSRPSDGRVIRSEMLDSTGSKGLVVEGTAEGQFDVLHDSPEWDEDDFVIALPRKAPAGHSSTVRDAAKAEIYCLDVGINDGPEVISKNARSVRFASGGSGAAGSSEHTLGVAEIEDDGSFFVEVPANTPIRMELLDGNGKVLRTMNNWTWVMPGERRGCIGCHEDPLLSPPNRHVLALRKPAQKLQAPGREGSLPITNNPDRK